MGVIIGRWRISGSCFYDGMLTESATCLRVFFLGGGQNNDKKGTSSLWEVGALTISALVAQ